MAFSRRTLSILTVSLVVTLLGGARWRLRSAGQGTQVAQASEAAGDASVEPSGAVDAAFSTDIPQPVAGVEVVRDTLWLSANAAGRAEAIRRATLQTQVVGVVEQVVVRENSAVAPGAPLLQIDTTEYALAVARAESDLRKARADFEQRVLFDDRIEDAAVRAQRERIARATSGLDQAEVAYRQGGPGARAEPRPGALRRADRGSAGGPGAARERGGRADDGG